MPPPAYYGYVPPHPHADAHSHSTSSHDQQQLSVCQSPIIANEHVRSYKGTIDYGPPGSAVEMSRPESPLQYLKPRLGPGTPSLGSDDPTNNLNEFTCHVQEFVSLPITAFVERGQFLVEHPDTRRVPLPILLKKATEHMMRGDTASSQKLTHSLVMLRISEDRTVKDVLDCFERMRESSTKENKQLRTMVGDVTAQVCKAAMVKKGTEQHARLPMVATAGSSNESSRHKYDPIPSTKSAQKAVTDTAAMELHHSTQYKPALERSSMYVSPRASLMPALQPDRCARSDMQTLSSNYRVQRDEAKFFRPGKVFSILWHEPAGQLRSVQPCNPIVQSHHEDRLGHNMTLGPYGEMIYSQIRRMVVITNRQGFCVCIPISTYSGQGLHKRTLPREEVNSHAIVYDSKKQPRWLPGEPQLTKKPIAVDMVEGLSLGEAARLHYARPHTVNWNTKVMDLGMVSSRCISILLSDVAFELLADSYRRFQDS